MQRTQFKNISCSVARTLDIFGEWWTPLILRDIFYGIRRFDALRRHLGISRKILTSRLKTLVENEILEQARYQQHPDRFEYQLTERGRDLFPIIVMLLSWGDKWIYGINNAPVYLFDKKSNVRLKPILVSADTKQEIRYENIQARLGSKRFTEDWQHLQKLILESKS